MTGLHERLTRAADVIARRTGRDRHDVVVVLGSGLGGYPQTLHDAVAIPYEDIPDFPAPGAPGHSGTAYSVELGANRVLLLSGRVHAYEGYPPEVLTFALRTAVLAGCRKVVLTNASGGCAEGIEPGDLVLITDHINLSGVSPLKGDNDERLGPRFPDMTDVYTPSLRDKARAAAAEVGMTLREGVYLWWHGPMFETPAEIRMAIALGASLVGMSTVPEATAARHMGAQVLAISLCTNRAAGLAGRRITAEEVIECADRAAARFRDLFDALLPTL
ncbi:MAG: purine-nucleoside phosphorylase [bacterium]|nr:purine-nucleoside phosphorylase [bacterium]MDE0289075.1 purine-nucleoside phosphorylase [bacterium]MDE0439381.1 purine-nucleoside phosphorylase [bacterium]